MYINKKIEMKEIKTGRTAKEEMLIGIKVLYDSVVSTLGPNGRNVIIEDEDGELHITKDGVTVAKSINIENKLQDLAIRLVKKVSMDANEVAGDGTTTATVLAYNIIKEGLLKLNLDTNPIELKYGIDVATKYVVDELDKIKTNITSDEEIKNVALVSSNNDKKISVLLSNAITEVGREGIITVEDSPTTMDESEFVNGIEFNSGYTSHHFITDNNTQEVILNKPSILIYDGKITTAKQLTPILEQLIGNDDKSLLIIADDIEGEALAVLIVNKIRNGLNVASVKAPSYGTTKANILGDIAILTGTTVISKEKGEKIELIKDFDVLGKANKIKISNNKTIIIDGVSKTKEIDGEMVAFEVLDRAKQIQTSISNASGTYQKQKLQERLAKLVNGVAIIRIGAETELELNERKDRFEDALNATKSAVEDGILPGAGLSLIRMKHTNYQTSDVYKELNKQQQIGFDILMTVLDSPFDNILKNANLIPEIIWDKIKNKNANFGYDVRNDKYDNLMKLGIIDPAKVVKTSLMKASSVAGLLLTTNTIVLDNTVKEESTPPNNFY